VYGDASPVGFKVEPDGGLADEMHHCVLFGSGSASVRS
jgi:hypothetical protein